MNTKLFFLFICGFALLGGLSSCDLQGESINDFSEQGYKPVYLTRQEIEDIKTLPAKTMTNPGKIYVKDNFLFVNERFEGIHIINNADPTNPVKVSFIKIPGNIDMAATGNVLYVDNGTDLVTLNISNPNEVRVVNRVKDAFPMQNFPPFTGVYFECADDSKGIVVSWEWANLDNAQCFR